VLSAPREPAKRGTGQQCGLENGQAGQYRTGGQGRNLNQEHRKCPGSLEEAAQHVGGAVVEH
jgi:hypothetical protein